MNRTEPGSRHPSPPSIRRRRRGWLLCAAVIAFAWAIPAVVGIVSPGNPNPFITPMAVGVTLLAVGFALVRNGRFGDSRMADLTLALGVVLAASALSIQFGERGGDLRRAGHVAHMVAGMLVILPVHLYAFAHLSSALRRRPVELVQSGVGTLVLLLLATWTGLLVLVFQAPEVQGLGRPHGWLSWLLLVPLVFHVVKGRRALRAQGEARPVARRALGISAGALAVFALVLSSYDRSTLEVAPHTVPGSPLPESLAGLSNAQTVSGKLLSSNVHNRPFSTCGSFDSYCHVDNVNQWKRSAHNHSANPVYRAVLERFERDRPGSSGYCKSCHEPFSALGEAPPGAPLDPLDEGVGCTLCHAVRPRHDVSGVASYQLAPVSAHFARLSRIFFFAFPLVLADLDLHSAEFLSEEAVSPRTCGTCHQHRVPDAVHPGIPGLDVTNKLGAWEASLYGPGGEEETACRDCHMPEIYGPIDPMTTRSHAFPSGNTGLPWLLGLDERLAENRNFLEDDKVRLSTDCERDAEPRTWSCDVTILNQGVGHEFPSGLRDVAEVWLEARVRDSGGATLWEAGQLDEGGRVVDAPLTYRQHFEDAEGTPLVGHEFWNAARVQGRPAILPRGEDHVLLRMHLPEPGAGAEGPPVLTVRLMHRRYNADFARTVLDRDPLQVPLTEFDRVEISLP